tara:strand:- start:222 stop:404 length:183 start_codon:yes stop_codon:yes gene_type:complete
MRVFLYDGTPPAGTVSGITYVAPRTGSYSFDTPLFRTEDLKRSADKDAPHYYTPVSFAGI